MIVFKNFFSLPTLLVLSMFVSQMALDLYSPALPYIAEYFEVTNDLAQMTLSICLIGLGLGSLTLGPISDVFGRRWVLLSTFIIFLFSTFVCASSPSVWGLIVARFFQGYAIGGPPIIALAVIRDIYPPNIANRLMSLTGGIIALAPALAPTLGGVLTENYGWRSCFYLLLWLGLLLLILLFFYMPETLKPSENSPRNLKFFIKDLCHDIKNLMVNAYFLNVVAVSSLMVACIWMYIGVAPFLFKLMGVGAKEYGWYCVITVSGYILGSLVNSFWGYRYRFTSLFMFGFTMIIFFSFILFLLDVFNINSPLLISLNVAAHSFGLAFIFPITNALAMEAGTKSGLTASILNGIEIFVSSTAVISITVEDINGFVYISLIRLLTCVAALLLYQIAIAPRLKLSN